MEKFVVTVVAIVALVLGGFAAFRPETVREVVKEVGGASTEHSFPEKFFQPVTFGGNVLATSSVGSATYTAASLQNTTLIQHTAASALTVALPASSTLTGIIPKAGDSRTIYLNAITSNITVTGGTGTDLNSATSTPRVIANGVARLDFIRKANSDIEVLFTSGI